MKIAPFFLLLPVSVVTVAAADLQSLVDNSPFGKAPVVQNNAPPTEVPPLEFRGVYTEAGVRHFSVFDPSSQRSYWLAEGAEEKGIAIQNFDTSSDKLTVQHQGRTYQLSLKTASITGSPVAAAPQMPVNNGSPQVRSAEADQRRLEAVAAEVRRRRALRQAAAQQSQQQQ